MGQAAGRGGLAGGRTVARRAGGGIHRFRNFTRSGGADESGLARVTEMQVLASAGDAAFTVSLASTVLALPIGQARGQVAIFLLTTMAPFVLLAPMVGPLLDRWRHGRRWAIGVTLAARAFLSWALAGVLADGSPWLLPLALLCLIAARTYAVALSAGIPLVRPASITLVTANSRQSIGTLVGMLVGVLLAAPVSRIGPEWSLRLAFVMYVTATVQAIRLPPTVDSPPATHPGLPPASPARPTRRRWRGVLRAGPLPPAVNAALVTAAGAKALSGFVTLFLGFLLWDQPLEGISSVLTLGLVVLTAGVGNGLGSLTGNRLGPRSPTVVAVTALVAATAVTVVTVVQYSLWTLLALGAVSGMFGQLAKLCLDALIQQLTPAGQHSRIFSWSETRLQAAWVAGGGLGIVMPLNATVGFAAMAATLVGVLIAAQLIRARADA